MDGQIGALRLVSPWAGYQVKKNLNISIEYSRTVKKVLIM